MALQPGDRVYRVNRKKSVMLAVIGRESLSEGAQIVACHIDSPRLDLKPHPIYEDSELAYGKTHYYGGIRKYQWVAIPLQLRGVVALKDGTAVSVVLGEGDEPKFVINDLLPHLGGEQGKKPLNEAIAGETLNILMGSRPLGDSADSDRVKLRVLDLLNNNNAQGELYLTDVPALLKAQGLRVGLCDTCSPDEMLGVNTLEQLAQVEALLRGRGGPRG